MFYFIFVFYLNLLVFR